MKFKGHILTGDTALGTIKYLAPSHKTQESSFGTFALNNVEAELFDAAKEIAAFDGAIATHKANLEAAREQQISKGNKVGGDILDAHLIILEDEGFIESFRELIGEKKVPVVKAINRKRQEYEERFKMSGVDFLVTKADDIRDICNSLIDIINHSEERDYSLANPTIIVAREILPGELLKYASGNLVGLVLEKCSRASHVFILANSMGIPVISDMRIDSGWEGRRAVIDCHNEYLIVDPSEEELSSFAKLFAITKSDDELLRKYIDMEAIASSGKRIYIGANVSGIGELEDVKKSGADGIGLFRSEMTYLEADKWPTENELFDLYSQIIKKMDGKPVTIRTLDIGADKTAPYMNISCESNPALGCRAIRQCLARPEVFKTQLRAIYKAAKYSDGNLSILYPMISSEEELEQIKDISKSVRRQLRGEGLLSDSIVVREGIMIETPAAAILSDKLAGQVDFFSIGTNDLTQFVYAVDRNNHEVSSIYNDCGEAVLRLVEMIIGNAHKAGIPVGMCGELAANTAVTDKLIAMGIDELSVSPVSVLKIKQQIIK